MSIASIILGGFGNGTASGSIALVVTRGYGIGEAIDIPDSIFFTNISAGIPAFHSISATLPTFGNISATLPTFGNITIAESPE